MKNHSLRENFDQCEQKSSNLSTQISLLQKFHVVYNSALKTHFGKRSNESSQQNVGIMEQLLTRKDVEPFSPSHHRESQQILTNKQIIIKAVHFHQFHIYDFANNQYRKAAVQGRSDLTWEDIRGMRFSACGHFLFVRSNKRFAKVDLQSMRVLHEIVLSESIVLKRIARWYVFERDLIMLEGKEQICYFNASNFELLKVVAKSEVMRPLELAEGESLPTITSMDVDESAGLMLFCLRSSSKPQCFYSLISLENFAVLKMGEFLAKPRYVGLDATNNCFWMESLDWKFRRYDFDDQLDPEKVESEARVVLAEADCHPTRLARNKNGSAVVCTWMNGWMEVIVKKYDAGSGELLAMCKVENREEEEWLGFDFTRNFEQLFCVTNRRGLFVLCAENLTLLKSVLPFWRSPFLPRVDCLIGRETLDCVRFLVADSQLQRWDESDDEALVKEDPSAAAEHWKRLCRRDFLCSEVWKRSGDFWELRSRPVFCRAANKKIVGICWKNAVQIFYQTETIIREEFRQKAGKKLVVKLRSKRGGKMQVFELRGKCKVDIDDFALII